MGSKDLLTEALKLSADEKFLVVEGLLKSLDTSNPAIENLWNEEAERRLQAYRNGKLQGIPMEEIFKED